MSETYDAAESVPTQLANGERHAERRGWVVAGRFKDDGFSAFKESQRDDFVRLVGAIEAEPLTSVKGEQIDAWYSGKARRHGGNVQAVTRPDGLPLWVGPAEPGSVHDLTAARLHALPALYRAAALGMPCLADSGYEGAGIGILVPFKNPAGNQELDIDNRTRNALLRDLRCRGERGFALLTQRWAALQHITADPDRTTQITRAALVLTQYEHKYIS